MATTDPLEKLNNRMIELEISLSHHQELVAQLDRVVTEQATRIQTIETAFGQLKTHQQSLRDMVAERATDLPPETPPHY